MNNQSVRIEWKYEIQKIRQPTAYCQACLGQKVEPNDFMLTCTICQGTIHKTHYASQLIGKNTNQNHLTPNLEDWKCQRCRYLIQRKFSIQVKCQFCPFQRGIMKKVIYQTAPNSRKQIWVHPQCITWCYPIIWMKSKKRTHCFKETPSLPTAKFWFRVQNQPTSKCQFCLDSYGYKIKCSFYSCQKFFHVTCAKRFGVVRDLESMRFQANVDDFCPVYCEQHLEAYVLDFANRMKLYTQRKQTQKVAHFTKVHNLYKIQLRNLNNSAKRSKQEQQMRNQLGKQLLIHNFQQSSMSLSVSAARSNQMNSSDSESHSSTFLAFLGNQYDLKDLDVLVEKNKKQRGQNHTQQKKQRHMKKNNEVLTIPNPTVSNELKMQQQKENQFGEQFKESSFQEVTFKTPVEQIDDNQIKDQSPDQNRQVQAIDRDAIVDQDQQGTEKYKIQEEQIHESLGQNQMRLQEEEFQNTEYEKLSFSFNANQSQNDLRDEEVKVKQMMDEELNYQLKQFSDLENPICDLQLRDQQQLQLKQDTIQKEKMMWSNQSSQPFGIENQIKGSGQQNRVNQKLKKQKVYFSYSSQISDDQEYNPRK